MDTQSLVSALRGVGGGGGTSTPAHCNPNTLRVMYNQYVRQMQAEGSQPLDFSTFAAQRGCPQS